MSRHKNAYNTLAASALLMLLIDPLLIYSAGFQLSYCAVLGILFLHRPLYGLLYFKNYLPDKIWSITAVSIAAQAGTLPVVLYYFHQFPLYSLITNLIVIPLSSLIIYAGMLFFLMPSHSVAADAAAWLLGNLIHIMDAGVTLVEDIPYGLVKDMYVDLPMALMIALGIICVSAYFILKNKSYLFYTLLLGLFFSSYRTLRSYDILKQEAFIVYSVIGHSAYDCINGDAHVFYADSLLLSSPSKIEYSIATNWLRRGLDPPQPANPSIQTLKAKRYALNATRKRIMVLSGDLPDSFTEKKLQLDYLILSGYCRFDLADIFGFFDTELVILDTSVPPWITAPEGDRRFYDVREKGAFVSSGCRALNFI
jgi:competence protein ComEC